MKPNQFPAQDQSEQPGVEQEMHPQPEIIKKDYIGSNKLLNKVVLITGGDSGIGRAVAVHFAKEGANVAIVYLDEIQDAKKTLSLVEKEKREGLLIQGDIRKNDFCAQAVKATLDKFGQLDILVNNAAVHYPEDNLEDITYENLTKTFETNVFSFFFMTQNALKHLKKGGRIINTTSVVSYRGSSHLIDYASTKGAITSFTRALSANLASKGILVNAVAPGPIWTPLIPAAFNDVTDFGTGQPLGRAGQPSEVAPAYVYLASEDSSYTTGQVIHVNGGEIVGG